MKMLLAVMAIVLLTSAVTEGRPLLSEEIDQQQFLGQRYNDFARRPAFPPFVHPTWWPATAPCGYCTYPMLV
jgi:hypothetical protein